MPDRPKEGTKYWFLMYADECYIVTRFCFFAFLQSTVFRMAHHSLEYYLKAYLAPHLAVRELKALGHRLSDLGRKFEDLEGSVGRLLPVLDYIGASRQRKFVGGSRVSTYAILMSWCPRFEVPWLHRKSGRPRPARRRRRRSTCSKRMPFLGCGGVKPNNRLKLTARVWSAAAWQNNPVTSYAPGRCLCRKIGSRTSTPHRPQGELEALRRFVRRGCPFGSLAWQKRMAATLGLAHTLRRLGRPRKASPRHRLTKLTETSQKRAASRKKKVSKA